MVFNIASSILLTFFLNYSAMAGTSTLWEYEDYKIITSTKDYMTKATLYKGTNEIFEAEDGSFTILNYNPDLDLISKDKKILILAANSGGAHCCNSYYLLTLSESSKLIQKISAFDSILSVSKSTENNSYTLSLKDVTFSSFYGPYSSSFFPEILLTFNGKYFAPNRSKMSNKLSQESFEELKTNITAELNTSADISKVTSTVLTLIYSGNGDLAWQLIDYCFDKYNFYINPSYISSSSDLSNKKAIQVNVNQFKTDLLNTLACSQYYKAIKKMNQGKLEFSGKCQLNNN
jgi:hypothetical protein